MGSCYWLCWLLPCWRVGVPYLQEDVFVVRHHHYRRGSRGRAGIHSLDVAHPFPSNGKVNVPDFILRISALLLSPQNKMHLFGSSDSRQFANPQALEFYG